MSRHLILPEISWFVVGNIYAEIDREMQLITVKHQVFRRLKLSRIVTPYRLVTAKLPTC